MASQATAPKPTSRWGSLLQQAVAGVESRLDTILADDVIPTTSPKNQESAELPGNRESVNSLTNTKAATDVFRGSSISRENDKLQKRLAKAVVSRSNFKSDTSSTLPSRTPSPTKNQDSQRTGFDSKDGRTSSIPGTAHQQPSRCDVYTYRDERADYDAMAVQADAKSSIEFTFQHNGVLEILSPLARQPTDPRCSTTSQISEDVPESSPNESQWSAWETIPGQVSAALPSLDIEVIKQMKSDYESSERRRQEEMHQYLEHIDALQAKLQYFINEAVNTANRAKKESKAGNFERELASKDEKIALLMDEGHKLSQNELKHVNTIRKLRAQTNEDEKKNKQNKSTIEGLSKAVRAAQERVIESEMARREDCERLKSLVRLEEELNRSKSEIATKVSENKILRLELARAQHDGNADSVKYRDLLEAELKVSSDLRHKMSQEKAERDLSEDRQRLQYEELQEKTNREKEWAKVTEIELRGELKVLESRLESFRARAEEVSSATSGDIKAKLFRQIETLQTQYSVASENWRGIESSLMARIVNLETERDDIIRREGDIRRKARLTAIKSREHEDQLEHARGIIQEMEQQEAQQISQLSTLRDAQATAEFQLSAARKQLESERETWKAQVEERIEAEKIDLHLHTPGLSSPNIPSELPSVSSRQKGMADMISPHTRRYQGGFGLGLNSPSSLFSDHPIPRRHSGHPLQSSGGGVQHPQDSQPSTPRPSSNNGVLETPSFHGDNENEMYDGLITPATPERTINDMFSASTAAAGPSVQLVERMSAAVRRLESDKAASKDELDRLSAQRNEAREQVVTLMREAEDKRASDAKIHSLETEVEEINRRYQTTLEMLGEKSELVEELQADIIDVKQMYRDLVVSTMR